MGPDNLGADLLSAVARLNRWATRHADLPIPPAQARLLAQIDELGAARIGDLARADHCSQPTMTAQIQRLEDRGWVSRSADPQDGRAVLISLSASGIAILDEVRRAREAVVAPFIARLTQTERTRLEVLVGVMDELVKKGTLAYVAAT